MKTFTIGFGIKEEFINDTEKLNQLKALANKKALDTITKYVTDSKLSDETINITTGEWTKGLPYEEAPSVIPFTRTFMLEQNEGEKKMTKTI